VHFPKSLRSDDEQARFAALGADLAVVAAYGLILPRPILESPAMGCINVHASLLPRWRGAAPIQRAILAGDEVTGVTIMRMEEGLDTGPMLSRRATPIERKNAGQLTEELSKIGAQTLLEWLSRPSEGTPQPEAGATYANKVDKAEARIDWGRSAQEIERQVRAFAPSPGAWFEAGGERIKLLECDIAGGSGRSGEVLDESLTIATGAGSVRPLKVQRAGRSPMSVVEFLRGFAVPRGTLLP
jgi:methionyl-tRNA formyltransferase